MGSSFAIKKVQTLPIAPLEIKHQSMCKQNGSIGARVWKKG